MYEMWIHVRNAGKFLNFSKKWGAHLLHWSCQHALPYVTLFLSSAPMALGSMAAAHGPLNCHSILMSHRELVGLPSLTWCTAIPDAPMRCGSMLVLPVQNEKVTEKTKVMSKPIRKPKQPGVSVETLHLLSNQRNANQQITKNCTAVSSSRLQPLSGIMGMYFLLYLFVGFLFPEPDIGGFRSISLKTPELQVLHMVWKKNA